MREKTKQNEILEAIWAGEAALRCLERARDGLEDAGDWGLFDLFGGGLLAGFVKHSKLEEVSVDLEQSKQKLAAFQRELKDVELPGELKVEIHGFLLFADFFFDGLVSDWLVQEKIDEAKEQVEEAVQRVSLVLKNLQRMLPGREGAWPWDV